jgi:hypothetical protein
LWYIHTMEYYIGIKNDSIRGVVQVIECLLCKCKVLSSNPSPPKKENKKQEHQN